MESPMVDPVFNVLFLCTGNSARSIMAEAILNQDAAGRFRAFSAGSRPKGAVDPLALKVLASYGYAAEGLSSKGWDVFGQPGAPEMDFVFTVCDEAAGEACPIWPGHPATAHWGIDDPSRATGNELAREGAYVLAFRYLKNRISAFLSVPLAAIDRLSLHHHLAEIGRMEGSSSLQRS
jgi:arsenate reductase